MASAPLNWEQDLRAWPAWEWPAEPVRAPEPSLRSRWEARGLAGLGTVAVGAFFGWLFAPAHRGDAWLFWPLALSLAYNAVWWMMEWSSYVRPRFEPVAAARHGWSVDVLTTACPSEPRGMILRTLRAMQAIRYPHTSYLCDEGNDPALRQACAELGIIHVTRTEKRDAKAGNINHALRQATGEIAVIIDPDHEPSPCFLDRVLGYFEDPRIGFVQSVQAYRNARDSFVADGAAKQTYLFYGPIMIGLHAYGVTPAVGANCVFRRAALDSIGGHAPGLAEDMHTTLLLYAEGWRSVYVPEVLTRGLVPSTLGGYCQQQAKWACGSMDLLLRVYPRVFRRLSGWQKLHYFFAPLYFLRGVVGLIDLLVPIVCLSVGGVALRMDPASFLGLYLPAFALSTLMRQVAQRWSIEKSEQGTHLAGSILGFGCWWSFLRGTLCAVTGRRLPYVPTEKENEAQDSWRLCVPNLVAIGASLAAIGYGLSRDWSPFTFTMAGFALWNVVQLTVVTVAGQQRTGQRLRAALGLPCRMVLAVKGAVIRLHRSFATGLRHYAGLLALPLVALAVQAERHPHHPLPNETAEGEWREPGGFYLGASAAAAPGLGVRPRLCPTRLVWNEDAPLAAWRAARARGEVPLIDWIPPVPAGGERALCPALRRGDYDTYLAAFAETLRTFGEPVLIRFAPRPGDSAQPWSGPAGNTPEDFRAAWVHVVSLLNRGGATNAGWIWSPEAVEDFASYYPGDNYVDWIGFNCTDRLELAEQYGPLREVIRAHRLPVLLSDFGSARPGWETRALRAVAGEYDEVRGLLLREPAPGAAAPRRAGLAAARFSALPPPALAPATGAWREQPRAAYGSPFITGSAGHFELQADGRPFYIRGVTYNLGHDWRDGSQPLTRRELEADFTSVQRLGANTIRRYGGGWADRNLLTVAGEKNLKVLYGFWFEQAMDYASDAAGEERTEALIEKTVREWKDRPCLLGWSLGNEVWGLLKHHYAQPYLTEVRHAHIDFVERLARRLHELDPAHPVFVAHEHSPELAGALSDFACGAPALDFTGVNSYYEHRISELRELAERFDPHRPYLISEFGTDGYWDPYMTQHGAGGAPLEPSSGDKIASYERAWTIHTEPHRGANIGAVAYCWRNRLEATATWFGLNDAQGLPKPAYFALQKMWRGSADAQPPRLTKIDGGGDEAAPGSTIEVHAVAAGTPGRPLRYQWQLSSRDFDFSVGRIRSNEDGTRARITMPAQPGLYRVYVHVSDGQAADEANFPIVVTAAPTVRR